MELTLKVDFWFDGIDDCSEADIKHYLTVMLETGAEATCSEVSLLEIK